MERRLDSFLIFLLFLLSSFSLSSGNGFNLFMNETETTRLLGIPGELYYVREGMVNEYALSFMQPIREDLVDIFFNWYRTSPEPMIKYSLAIAISDVNAMMQPSASIKQEGNIPEINSVFRISLPCSGLSTAEVDVKILLRISSSSSVNVTSLALKRRKTCHINGTQKVPDEGELLLNEDWLLDPHLVVASSPMRTVIYTGLACGAGILLLTCVVFIITRLLRSDRKPPTDERNIMSDVSSSASAVSRGAMSRDAMSRDAMLRNKILSIADSVAAVDSAPLNNKPSLNASQVLTESDYLEVPWTGMSVNPGSVSITEILNEGAYARLCSGKLFKKCEDTRSFQRILIKTVSDNAPSERVEEFLKEGQLTRNLLHDNLACLIAVCMEDPRKPQLIYTSIEQAENLKTFLLRCRPCSARFKQPINTHQLVYIGVQVSKAISYLHSRNIIHRDVATRNCIVNDQLCVQVTDGALSKDLFPADYHLSTDNENRPIKWLSLETLIDNSYSFPTDTWSFGVLLWELVTLAQQPYADIDPSNMAAHLKTGYRATQPAICPNELFSLMLRCWLASPSIRPTFAQLYIDLENFHMTLGQFI